MHIPENDPFEDGTVVRYVRTLSGKRYTYVAIRAAGSYYASSSDINYPMTWQQFSDLLFSDRTSDVSVVMSWMPWDEAIGITETRPTIEAAGETWELRDERLTKR